MTTTVEAVNTHMRTDPVLADALARGFISLRRTARKLIETYGWETTEEAVVSALRRYKDAHPRSPLREARRQLKDLLVSVEGGLALVTLPPMHTVQSCVLDAWGETEEDQILGVYPARRKTLVLLESTYLRAFSQHLDPRWVRDTEAQVSAVRITVPDESYGLSILMIALTALAHHGVDVLDLTTAPPEYSILVNSDRGPQAYEIVMDLRGGPPDPVRGAREHG